MRCVLICGHRCGFGANFTKVEEPVARSDRGSDASINIFGTYAPCAEADGRHGRAGVEPKHDRPTVVGRRVVATNPTGTVYNCRIPTTPTRPYGYPMVLWSSGPSSSPPTSSRSNLPRAGPPRLAVCVLVAGLSSCCATEWLNWTESLTAQLQLPPDSRLPLAHSTPSGAQVFYWAQSGEPARVLRISAAPSTLRVEAAAELPDATQGDTLTEARLRASGGRPLQVSSRASDPVVASVVDWRSGRAYVALAPTAACAAPLIQLAVPALVTLSATCPASVGMSAVSSMALGGEATETLDPPAWLFLLLASSSGQSAELQALRLPELQPTHALRFAVPSPVAAAHYDARSDAVYLLCAGPTAKLIRVWVLGGKPVAPPGPEDTLTPGWRAALPLLLPFPHSRWIVFLSGAAPPEGRREHDESQPPPDAGSGSAPWLARPPSPPSPLRVCRVPLEGSLRSSTRATASASTYVPDHCTQLRGRFALEQPTAAAPDDAAGVVYIGCASGAALRLRLYPLRVEALLQPASVPLTAAIFRPGDGTLWLASDAGLLMQFATRSGALQHDLHPRPPDMLTAGTTSELPATPPPPAWLRWRQASMPAAAGPPVLSASDQSPPPPRPADGGRVWGLLSSWVRVLFIRWNPRGPSRTAHHAAADAMPPPLPPPPLPPPPSPPPLRHLVLHREHHRLPWLYHRLGMVPAVVFTLLGACCGLRLGGSLYRLLCACQRDKLGARRRAS